MKTRRAENGGRRCRDAETKRRKDEEREVHGAPRSRLGFVGDSRLMYAARVANDGGQSQGRELIRARVAVWRAQAWTSWLPAMVILPVVIFVIRNVPTIVEYASARDPELLDLVLPNFLFNSITLGGGLIALCLISWGLQWRAPRLGPNEAWLRLGYLISYGISMIWVVLSALGVVGDLVGAALATESPSHGLPIIDEAVFLAAGLFITCWVGIRRRVDLQCARCGYEIGSLRRAGDRCPECRNKWKRVGGLRRFRRISIWWLVGGLGLIVMAGAMRFVASR